jgi:hypothetical protein
MVARPPRPPTKETQPGSHGGGVDALPEVEWSSSATNPTDRLHRCARVQQPDRWGLVIMQALT